MIIYDTARMYNKNPYMLCLGAYHAGQAVEKTLKYVLALVNADTSAEFITDTDCYLVWLNTVAKVKENDKEQRPKNKIHRDL